MIVYDFGAGYRREPGVIAVDADPAVNPDIVADVTQPIPGVPGGSADEVHCNHVLEHIPHPGHFLVLQEICRVLRVGGRFVVKVPHPSHDSAMVPGHVHVLPPHYWRDIQANPRGYMGCALVIDSIDEPMLPGAAELAHRVGILTPEALRTLRNLAAETVVTGHKVSP
jgi:hypothetical protein